MPASISSQNCPGRSRGIGLFIFRGRRRSKSPRSARPAALKLFSLNIHGASDPPLARNQNPKSHFLSNFRRVRIRRILTQWTALAPPSDAQRTPTCKAIEPFRELQNPKPHDRRGHRRSTNGSSYPELRCGHYDRKDYQVHIDDLLAALFWAE